MTYRSPTYTNESEYELPGTEVPKSIVKAGQSATKLYAQHYSKHTRDANCYEFAIGLGEFLGFAEQNGLRDIADVDADMIADYVEELEHAFVQYDQILARLCSLKLFFDSCAQDGLIASTPLSYWTSGYHIPHKIIVESGREEQEHGPSSAYLTAADLGRDSSPKPTFLSAYIRTIQKHSNRKTQDAYYFSLKRFLDHLETTPVTDIGYITGHHFNQFVASLTQTNDEGLTKPRVQTIRATMAAVRALFDSFVVDGLITNNIANSVDLPRLDRDKGSTPVIDDKTLTAIIDGIPLKTPADYRDRALIGLMAYSMLRISAALSMTISDYHMRGDIRYLRSVGKRSKLHEVPVHEILQHYIDDYLLQTQQLDNPKMPLFQGSTPHGGHLTGRPYTRNAALKMVKRRAAAAGYHGPISNHTFRATGITNYLKQEGSTLEEARRIAGHKSADTTRQYNRNIDGIDPDEVNKI